jgi:hypothetical protein
MSIECGDRVIDDYVEDCNTKWAKVLKRIDAQQEKKSLQKDTPRATAEPKSQVPEPKIKQFCGGAMTFLAKSVELCGVDICSGSRSEPTRKALDLLRQKNANGGYQAYSGEELMQKIGCKSRQSSAAGLIRDLRKRISEVMRAKANIDCGDQDVILSGGPGYRLSDRVIVQDEGQNAKAPVTDTGGKADVRNHADDDVPNVPDSAAAMRRAWILDRLQAGDQLRAPAIAKHFDCAIKTAQRDLQSLKDEGRIEFDGAPRTGCYRLRMLDTASHLKPNNRRMRSQVM